MSEPHPARTRNAAQVVRHCALSAAATKLLDDRLSVEDFYRLLVREGLPGDAIRLAACAFPKAAGVWWACLCLWEVYRPSPPPKADSALVAAVRWVQEPSEEHRRGAEAAGMDAGMDAPAGLVALAAFYAEGSITPPGLPEVAPHPDLTGKMLAAALTLALEMAPAADKPRYQRLCLQLAGQVANGQLRWDP